MNYVSSMDDALLLSHRKAHYQKFFLCIFSSLTCLKKPVFSEGDDLLRWKVPANTSSLAQQNGFGPTFLHRTLRLAKGPNNKALTPAVDWLEGLIAPMDCLLYSPAFCSPSFSFMGEVEREKKTQSWM